MGQAWERLPSEEMEWGQGNPICCEHLWTCGTPGTGLSVPLPGWPQSLGSTSVAFHTRLWHRDGLEESLLSRGAVHSQEVRAEAMCWANFEFGTSGVD